MPATITVAPYPSLQIAVFETHFPSVLAELKIDTTLSDLLTLDADVPLSKPEELRPAVRDLLRHKGYKPTGRGKPASEYLVKAAEKEILRSINLAVDACNVVSLHSGFPISVIDLDKTSAPLTIKPAEEGETYVFNASGQEINVTGLLCLHDAEGPCANPVKDSERTKTSDTTIRTLTIVWGLDPFSEQREAATVWYESLLQHAGARIEWLIR